MKRRTIAQKYQDYFDAYKCLKEDRKVKRSMAKDGSISTNPAIELAKKRTEQEVLKDCLLWLKGHHIFCNRHDSGSFQNERGQWGTYGIKGAGDIIGLLPDGRHFEIEVKKSSGGRLGLNQQQRMQNIRDNNGLYFVVHNIFELENYLRNYI